MDNHLFLVPLVIVVLVIGLPVYVNFLGYFLAKGWYRARLEYNRAVFMAMGPNNGDFNG